MRAPKTPSAIKRSPHKRQAAGKDGHLWPAAPGKTPFPADWGEDKIMHNISDIATDPHIQWKQQTGSPGASFTHAGDPDRHDAIGVREVVKIRVIIEHAGEGNITGHPIQ